MRAPFRIVLIAAFVAAAASTAAAGQGKSWVGELVVYTKHPEEIKFGDVVNGKQINFPFSGFMPIKVRAEKGGRLRVHDGYREGWVDKADFVLSNEAPAYFDRRVQANPKDTFALYMRGAAWSDKGEFDKAIKDFGECIRLDSTQAAYFNCRGVAWSGKKNYDKAIADYNEAIRLDPNYGLAFNSRGNAWSNKKNYDKAISDYNEAIRLDPNDASVYNNRGNAWTDKKNYDKAVADYNEAIRLDPNYANAYHNRGVVWHTKKNYDKAIADYNEAVRLDPKFVAVYYDRAIAWGKKKNYEQALADYGEVIRLDPNKGHGYNSRAWLLATCPDAKYRDGKKAVESAKQALELDSKSASRMDTLAAAYAESGNFAEAVRWQEKALADPQLKNDKDARRRLELYRDKKPYRQE